jgi:hypothetical protein
MFKHIYGITFDHHYINNQKKHGNINFMGIGPYALRSTV